MAFAGRVASRPGTRVGLALVVAVMLLLGARLGYGWLDSHYDQAFHSVAILPGSLERLPLAIGQWRGRSEAVPQALITATDTDAHVSRTYQSAGGLGTVSLWIGYGGRFRDLMPHRPEICYPASGYVLEGERRDEIQTPEGVLLPCRILRFARGGANPQRIAVLNYYLVDGEYSPDVSLLRSKAVQLRGGGRYMAQVQVSCILDPLSDAPDAPVRLFAAVSAGPIREVVQSSVQAALSAPAGKEQP